MGSCVNDDAAADIGSVNDTAAVGSGVGGCGDDDDDDDDGCCC